MKDIKNKFDYMLKGSIYGLFASTAIWLILGGVMLFFGSLERALLIASVGIPVWGITWGIAGAAIGAAGLKSAKWKLNGAVWGIIIGVASATLAIIWPRCDYVNIIEKVEWAIPVAIEMPVLLLLIPLNIFLQKTLGLTLEQGQTFEAGLMVFGSVILWPIFGAMLGKLIGREPKIKLP